MATVNYSAMSEGNLKMKEIEYSYLYIDTRSSGAHYPSLASHIRARIQYPSPHICCKQIDSSDQFAS